MTTTKGAQGRLLFWPHFWLELGKYQTMKVEKLDSQPCKMVYMRKDGEIVVRRVPVATTPSLPPHPMFPIERPQDGN